MTQNIIFDSQGNRVFLGPELGRGGEAAVYAVTGQPTLVAKIYHQPPDAEKCEKLKSMVELQSERLLSLAAWPVGTLYLQGRRSMVGFLMKNMAGFKDIHLLYSPKSRTREFSPKANWRFLIHTASNVARAFSAIHDHGHVIGDVNQSNVRVSPETAIVGLVDCDSFQISSGGKLYPCEVGVPLYTPPEMQETDFRNAVRTPNHDNFGLAVLVFHLLFMGRHPFAGKFLGQGEMPIEKAIAEHRFAFAKDVSRTQMLPPPSCITLEHLPEEVGDLFERGFGPAGAPAGRPDGKQWTTALDALSGQLMVCTTNKAHLYYRALVSCPWCAIEGTGVLLFVDYTIVDTTSGFSIEAIWGQILAVPNPGAGNPPSILMFLGKVQPSKAAKRVKLIRRLWIGAAVIGAIGLIALILTPDGFAYLILAGFAFNFVKSFLAKGWQNKLSQVARDAEHRFRRLQFEWHREAAGASFDEYLESMRGLAEEYRRLPEQRKKLLQRLERAQYEIQLRKYLEQFDVARADIPHVKDGRKAMLSAYGITDAGDITQAALAKVPGFGAYLVMQLLTWRQSLEANFKFNPGRGVDPADVQKVDAEIAKRRKEIEALLSRGPGDLKELRRRVVAARSRLQGPMEAAAEAAAQAQVDESDAA